MDWRWAGEQNLWYCMCTSQLIQAILGCTHGFGVWKLCSQPWLSDYSLRLSTCVYNRFCTHMHMHTHAHTHTHTHCMYMLPTWPARYTQTLRMHACNYQLYTQVLSTWALKSWLAYRTQLTLFCWKLCKGERKKNKLSTTACYTVHGNTVRQISQNGWEIAKLWKRSLSIPAVFIPKAPFKLWLHTVFG